MDLSGRTVLLAEDEPLIAIEICEALEGVGAKVMLASSLNAALKAVEDDRLSVAILDHGLGREDSSRVCARLKELHVPFFLYSGYAHLDGACANALHIEKPASSQTLIAAVVGLLSETAH
jgi:DNA-binding response OmpR family regulator